MIIDRRRLHQFQQRRQARSCTAISCAILGPADPGTRPDDAGISVGIEAEAAVTGNVIENAPTAGIRAGWGHYLR
jgi:putative cofactor-binding repeat protein